MFIDEKFRRIQIQKSDWSFQFISFPAPFGMRTPSCRMFLQWVATTSWQFLYQYHPVPYLASLLSAFVAGEAIRNDREMSRGKGSGTGTSQNRSDVYCFVEHTPVGSIWGCRGHAESCTRNPYLLLFDQQITCQPHDQALQGLDLPIEANNFCTCSRISLVERCLTNQSVLPFSLDNGVRLGLSFGFTFLTALRASAGKGRSEAADGGWGTFIQKWYSDGLKKWYTLWCFTMLYPL